MKGLGAFCPAIAVLIGVALAACGGGSKERREPDAAAAPPSVVSNVTRDDYAGSKSCEPCHQDIYRRWSTSPMRRMTRKLAETEIAAPFDGSRISFKDDAITVEQREGRKYMRVDSATHQTSTLYRVTKVVGGRYREDFVGVEVRGEGADDGPVGDARDEPVLPLSWLKFDSSWRYKGYSVMAKERPRIERGRSWRQTCIFCHNTTPLLTTIYDDLLGKSAKVYQGSVSDNLLPASRYWPFRATDEKALAASVGREVRLLTGKDPASADVKGRLGEAIAATERSFDERHLVEVGIGCEACHGGSREHVEHPERRPTYGPTSPFLAQDKPGGGTPTRAETINRVCARCHTVLFSRYPFTWEGGGRRAHPGGSSINSGEARDFLLGHCAGEMACTTCHDPHTEDPKAALDELGTVRGNRVCLGCHEKFRATAALAAHTHHATEGEGSACLGCHMPKKNTGLAYGLTRYHRIGSPTDKERVEEDRPLECAICHADKSVRDLVGTMGLWYGTSYDPARVADLYGDDLDQRATVLTLLRGKAHEQMTAADVLGERGKRADAKLVAALLTSEYPLARRHAKAAIEKLEGRPMQVDLDAEKAAIEASATKFFAASPPP